MHSLTDWKARFPKISQHGPFWCIPASIENMLRYAGLGGVSQEDLVLGYCQKYGEEALLEIDPNNPQICLPVSLKGLGALQIIQRARQCAFRHGNFETFAEPAKQKAGFKKANLALDFIGAIKTKASYFDAVTSAVKADRPVLISVKNPDGTCHIKPVLEVDADTFTAYDPALNTIETFNVANCVFSNDVLVLRR